MSLNLHRQVSKRPFKHVEQPKRSGTSTTALSENTSAKLFSADELRQLDKSGVGSKIAKITSAIIILGIIIPGVCVGLFVHQSPSESASSGQTNTSTAPKQVTDTPSSDQVALLKAQQAEREATAKGDEALAKKYQDQANALLQQINDNANSTTQRLQTAQSDAQAIQQQSQQSLQDSQAQIDKANQQAAALKLCQDQLAAALAPINAQQSTSDANFQSQAQTALNNHDYSTYNQITQSMLNSDNSYAQQRTSINAQYKCY